MGDLVAQLITPEVQAFFTVVIVLLVILYVLSIIWVIRDAYQRGATWYIWGIVALIPGIGVIAYCLLRPSMLQIDKDEQELEVALKQRELMKYGECALCGYPVEVDYVICPNCHTQLKNLCMQCNHALDPAWTICPYCATPVRGADDGATERRSSSQRRSRRRSSGSGSSRRSSERSSERSRERSGMSLGTSEDSPSKPSEDSKSSDSHKDKSSSGKPSSSSEKK